MAPRIGFKHSPETRARISASHIGRKHSPESRAKISAANKGRQNPPLSLEQRAKLRREHGLWGTKHYKRYRRYGLTPEAFEYMLTEQGNRCLVCGHEFTDTNPPVVDHDKHCCPFKGMKTCGQCIGGLLHSGCNAALGLLGDDPETCLMAAVYLKTRRKRFAGNLRSTPSIAKFYDAFLHIPAEPLTTAIQ
jgi:hypothetical protein